jgi:hypothetical protein
MRTALIFFLLALPTLAQEKAATTAAPAACGPDNVRFDVKLDKSPHPVAQPEPGKALVYFIQDGGAQPFGSRSFVGAMIGLDGAWVGANRVNSYFSVSVEPGEHHACADLHSVELAHFNAEAGGVYYFRVRAVGTPYGTFLFLDSLNSDEAKYLTASFPRSVSQPKK